MKKLKLILLILPIILMGQNENYYSGIEIPRDQSQESLKVMIFGNLKQVF